MTGKSQITEGPEYRLPTADYRRPPTAHRPPITDRRLPTTASGFTLIELLVVIAVIGILAALTVSAAMQVRGTMRVRTARGSAARLAQAIEAYQALKNFLPVHTLYNPETDADADYENYEIVNQINGIMSRDPLIKLESEEKNAYGSFKDNWGRAFRVVMWKEKVSDKYYKYFQVYSCGENARWEMGAGDDLAPKL